MSHGEDALASSACWTPPQPALSGVAATIAVGVVPSTLGQRERSRLVVSVEDLLEEARRLDLTDAEGRFRLGDIVEVLCRELPAVADLHERLALDLELERDTITEAWFVASAFPPTTRRPGLPWTTYVLLRFHPARQELVGRAAREGWDQDRLGRELSAWFTARYDRQSEPSA
jgi:hypothetical protein